MEKNITDDPMARMLLEEPQAVVAKWPAAKLAIKDENGAEKIGGIAEIVGFIGALIALVAGFVLWFQTNSVLGLLMGVLISVGGIVVSYFVVVLSYSYANMIKNSFEQTRILKRLEAQNLTSILRRNDDELLEQPISEAVKEDKKTDLTMANPDDDEDIEPHVQEPQPAENEKKDEKWPLVGIVDSRMRRVAHFKERSRYGIICPICNRKQSSDMDNCYFCDCRFVYDNEAPKSRDDLLGRLRHR